MKIVSENTQSLEVVKMPADREVPPLEIILKDPEVASFYKLIHEYDFRKKALDLLERKIGSLQ